MLVGDGCTAGGVHIGVAVVVHCDDIELPFDNVAGFCFSGGLVGVSDVGVIEKLFFFEDGGCSPVYVFSFFVWVEGASSE